jgi:hypothetical protein
MRSRKGVAATQLIEYLQPGLTPGTLAPIDLTGYGATVEVYPESSTGLLPPVLTLDTDDGTITVDPEAGTFTLNISEAAAGFAIGNYRWRFLLRTGGAVVDVPFSGPWSHTPK